MTEAFSNFTPWRTNMLQHNNWGMVFPNWGYWWGSNRNVAQNAMTLLLGSVILEGQDNIPTAVSEAADHAFDYLLGIIRFRSAMFPATGTQRGKYL